MCYGSSKIHKVQVHFIPIPELTSSLYNESTETKTCRRKLQQKHTLKNNSFCSEQATIEFAECNQLYIERE